MTTYAEVIIAKGMESREDILIKGDEEAATIFGESKQRKGKVKIIFVAPIYKKIEVYEWPFGNSQP